MTEDSRYPYTYACDLIRSFAGHNQGGTKISRADASQIRTGIAEAIRMDDDELARHLADHYKANEAKLSDEMAESAMRALADRFRFPARP